MKGAQVRVGTAQPHHSFFFVSHFCRYNTVREYGLFHYMTLRELIGFTNALKAHFQWTIDTVNNNWSYT